MSMANGNIVDGHFRLCVQIRDYKNSSDSKLEKGAYAIFYGKIDMYKPGSSYLSVDGMNKVIIDETKPKMPLEKLRLSFHKIPTPKPDRDTCNPKRSADDEKENSNRSMDTEKKLKND
uniref:XseA_1 protein n=1 Tax=Fopius arisanus TaxID=64838 RepID=A0A0C9QCS6_9HYME